MQISVTFDKINLSLAAFFGSCTLYLMVLKNNTDIISAHDAHDVGCLQLNGSVNNQIKHMKIKYF